MSIYYILWSFGIHIFPVWLLYREKSGNPELQHETELISSTAGHLVVKVSLRGAHSEKRLPDLS
jgi:hypothetical protein